MAAKTLIVARKVWVSKGLSKPANSRMGWTKSLVGWIMTSGLAAIVAEQRNSKGISGFVWGWCGREWLAVRDVVEEEEAEERGCRE